MKKYDVEVFFTDEEHSKFLKYLETYNKHINGNFTPESFIRYGYTMFGMGAKNFLDNFEWFLGLKNK